MQFPGRGWAVVLLFLAWTAIGPALFAGGSSWQVINQANGLPSSKITAFATSEKNMAVGTDLGVGVYNAETCLWAALPLPEQVASSEVRDLAYDREGNLWVATPRGLAHVQEGRVEVAGVREGLPNIDVERLQIVGPNIYVGCFGGLISRAVVPKFGGTTFMPVNYDSNDRADTLKIRSVGISALAMKDAAVGLFSTKGAGIWEIQGSACNPVDRTGSLPSDWIETFTVFTGKGKVEKMMVGTSSGLSLLSNGQLQEADVLPQPGLWMTGLITGKMDQMLPIPKNQSESDKKLLEFLEKRYLWIATKEHGLWRFQDGRWTQFLPETSRLPSRAVNRVYLVGSRIVACTDSGLVIIPLQSASYDEFKGRGLGSRFCLTLYPGPDYHKVMCPVNFIARGTDLWVSMEKGFCRFVGISGVSEALLRFSPEQNSAREAPEPPSDQDEGSGPAPVAMGGEKVWQIFKKDPTLLFYMEGVSWPIYSNNITSLAVDTANHPWMIFEQKVFARLRMVPKPKKSDEKYERIEAPEWDYFKKSQPWPGDTKLTALWLDEGRLYVGTKGMGFYVLGNPGFVGPDEAEFDWRSFSQLEGLRNQNIIGFARRKVRDGSEIAILHPDGLTLWNGKDFVPIDLGGRRTYSCITGDAQGNLWLGSDGGLFRLTPELKVVSYTGGNAFFESNRITAVAASNDTSGGGGLGVWVACDQNPAGSDEAPGVVKKDGKKHVIEADIDGASLHFFDGHTWDKWKIAGVRCLHMEGDYLFMGSNIRMRRLFAPVHMMKTEDSSNLTSDKVFNAETKGATDDQPGVDNPGNSAEGADGENPGEGPDDSGGDSPADGAGTEAGPDSGTRLPTEQELFSGE